MNSRLPTAVGVILGLGLGLGLLPVARGAPPAAAQTEIDYLLRSVERSGCEFYRNGSWYDAKKAQAHLRSKYEILAASGQINTAEDFIDKAATESSLSGRPYMMRCSSLEAVTTNQWLHDALTCYRAHGAACAPRITRGALGIQRIRFKPKLQSSFLTLMRLCTAFTPSVSRAMDTALSAASWVLALPRSHTTPASSVST
jgi:hypothetical protein